MMEPSKTFVYTIHCFDKESEKQVSMVDLLDPNPEYIRELFNPQESEYPYLFDSFPVIQDEQIEYICRVSSIKRSVFYEFDCYIESHYS